MAERRMFAKTIVLSDAFLDMPMSARCLYFTLGMVADDDGFVNSPRSIMRQCGASIDDMNILITKRFVLNFDSGVIVIKHWRINNYLRNDRYQATKYVKEKSELEIEKNGGYTLGIPNSGIPRIDKDRIEEECKEEYREIDNYYQPRARESYESIMEDMCLEEEVKPMMWNFIKHCQLNGKTLTNDKLTGILIEMDKQRLSPSEKIEALEKAINGGYYDIKR
nr:MAG TPA: replisome organizer [Caudoviricetes sp.]